MNGASHSQAAPMSRMKTRHLMVLPSDLVDEKTLPEGSPYKPPPGALPSSAVLPHWSTESQSRWRTSGCFGSGVNLLSTSNFEFQDFILLGVGILATKDQEAKYDKNTLANFQFIFHFHFLLNSNFELPHFAFKSFRLSAGGDITALVDLISRHVGDFPGFYSKWPCQS